MKTLQKIVAILLLFVEVNFSLPSFIFLPANPTPLPTPPVTTQKFLPVPTPTPFAPAPIPTPVPPPKVQRKPPGSSGTNPSPVNKNPLATSAQISALTSLQLFSEPLYPTAAPRISENNALIPALNAYANHPSADNTQALENFIETNPNNPWVLSVETNLGLLYAKGCYWTKALNTLDRVWNEGRYRSGYKDSIDMAVSQLAFVAARLGRVQYMQQLATSVGARILAPNAQDTYQRAKQSLDREVNHPEQGFLCGPQAVQSILTAINPSLAFTPAIGDVQSTQQGTSLTTVANLANAVGLKMTPVEWTSDTVQIPTPAVIHWKSGHYAALVGRTEDGGYHLIDRSMELDVTVSGPAIQKEGSGYFLIPTASVTSDFTPLTQGETDNIWGKGAVPTVTPPVPASVAPTTDLSSSNGQSCNGNNSSKSADSGMPSWAVDKLRIALILRDTPITYQPPVGPTIAFSLEYNHQNTSPSSTPFATYIGQKWTINYSSYLVPNGSSVTQYGPGGGTLTYSNLNTQTGQYAPQFYTNNILTKTGPSSYVLTFRNAVAILLPLYSLKVQSNTFSLRQ
jgi:peptidase C39-like protein